MTGPAALALLLALLFSLAGHAQTPAPIAVRQGLFDQSLPNTLGLPDVPATHGLLYRADRGKNRYSHHAQLAVYGDRLVAMWSSGIAGENQNGQHLLQSESDDGLSWAEPRILAGDPDGPQGPMGLVATGFHAGAEALVAYYVSVLHEQPKHPRNTLLARSSADAKTWSGPHAIARGFFLGNLTRIRDTQRLLLGGVRLSGQPIVLRSDEASGLGRWHEASVPENDAFLGAYPEPTWFQRRDGSVVMLLRTAMKIRHLYASTSDDGGDSWTAPAPTNFPDATARALAGNLPDGSSFIISNPSHRFGRIPLTIALSRDGRVFDRAFVIRGESTQPRFAGRAKHHGFQYPAAAIWREHLFVAYSINKEDVGFSRIALEDLRETRPPPHSASR